MVRGPMYSGVGLSTHVKLDPPLSPTGYGFVDFENPNDAQNAVAALQAEGVLAQFAKLPQVL